MAAANQLTVFWIIASGTDNPLLGLWSVQPCSVVIPSGSLKIS